jgi:hypothetical protein
MNKPSAPPTSSPIARVGLHRRYSSRRHAVTSQMNPHYIHKKVLDVFKKYDYEPIDLEALIFFTLKEMEVGMNNYEQLHRTVRSYIMSNFNLSPGKLLTLQETGMRRLTVVCSRTDG